MSWSAAERYGHMNKIKIELSGNFFLFFDEDTFIGKMDFTQMLLFYIAYKLNGVTDQIVLDTYCTALEVTPEKLKQVLSILDNKFEYLLKHKNIDFTQVDLNMLWEGYKTDVFVNRIQNFVPNKLAVSLTNKCYCRCKYCYAKENGKTNSAGQLMELDISAIKEILSYASKTEIHSINLTGGDPLAHSSFWTILDLCREYGVKVDFSTKKPLTSDDIREIANYSSQIQSLQFSIDSLYEAEVQKLVDPSYPDKLLHSIEHLICAVGNQIEIKVNSVITSFNIEHLLELSDVLFEMGVAEHGLSPYIFNLCTNNESFFPTYKQYEILRKKINKYKYKDRLAYPVSLGKQEGDFDYSICTAGIDALIINYDGEVYVCERFCSNREFSIGNMHEKSLTEIWNSDRIKQFSYPSKQRFAGTSCEKCDKFDYCIRQRGLCYVHSYILGGSIYSPDYYCTFKEQLGLPRVY